MNNKPEVTKYRVEHPWWHSGTYVYFNEKVWQGLPAKFRDMMTAVAIEVENEMPALVATFNKEEDDRQLKAGMQFIKLTPPDGDTLVQMANDAVWEQMQATLPAADFTKVKDLYVKLGGK